MTSPPKVGIMGLGKLGLPLALVLDREAKCQVTVYDPDPRPAEILLGRREPTSEPGVAHYLNGHQITIASDPKMLVRSASTVFIVVPTPHPPEHAGDRPTVLGSANPHRSLPDQFEGGRPQIVPSDFEYGYLVQAVRSLSRAAWELNRRITVAIVSTVMPGTIDREIRPVTSDEVTLVYTPSLIALGSVVSDLKDPEFVIVGVDRHEQAVPVCEVISRIHGKPLQIMDIPSAELTKIAYNTFSVLKTVFGNTVMELAHKTGADCDKVIDALSLAEKNLMSGRYMKGGMGSGGYCHPRDVLAGHWMARRLGIQNDLFGYLASARETQMAWLAGIVEHWHRLTRLPVVLLGEAYKPESGLTGGSPALLLSGLLAERQICPEIVDPYTRAYPDSGPLGLPDKPAVYVVSTAHKVWATAVLAEGSVVIDPHGLMPDRPGVTTIRIGRPEW